MGSGVTGEVHHVDAGYHTVGMVAVDNAAGYSPGSFTLVVDSL